MHILMRSGVIPPPLSVGQIHKLVRIDCAHITVVSEYTYLFMYTTIVRFFSSGICSGGIKRLALAKGLNYHVNEDSIILPSPCVRVFEF